MRNILLVAVVSLVYLAGYGAAVSHEKDKPEKVRVEKHKLKVDVKKMNPAKGKEVTETREFLLMFDITEKAQKHKAKRLEKEAEKAAKEAAKEAEKAEKKGKGQGMERINGKGTDNGRK